MQNAELWYCPRQLLEIVAMRHINFALCIQHSAFNEITPNFSSNHDVKSGVISLTEQVLSLVNLHFYCLMHFPFCFRGQFSTSYFFFLYLTESGTHLLRFFTCTLVSPLCVYNITQVFHLYKMGYSIKNSPCFCELYRK